MAELSRDEAEEILGPVGDVVIAEIIATGITKAQLIAAHERVMQDRETHRPGASLEPGPFARAVDILERSRRAGREGWSTME